MVAAGLVLGNYGVEIGMSPTTRLSITVFWDTLTLIANSLVFILVGLEITSINIFEHVVPIALAVVIVLASRSVDVFELRQAAAAGKEIDWLRSEGRVSPQVYDKLKDEALQSIDRVHSNLSRLYRIYPDLEEQQETDARIKLLFAEHQAVEKLLNEGVLSQETGEEKQQAILERLEGVERTRPAE